jgi:hypothetical protein
MHREFFLSSRSVARVGIAKLEWERNDREEQTLARFQIISPKDALQRSPVSSIFAENADHLTA